MGVTTSRDFNNFGVVEAGKLEPKRPSPPAPPARWPSGAWLSVKRCISTSVFPIPLVKKRDGDVFRMGHMAWGRTEEGCRMGTGPSPVSRVGGVWCIYIYIYSTSHGLYRLSHGVWDMDMGWGGQWADKPTANSQQGPCSCSCPNQLPNSDLKFAARSSAPAPSDLRAVRSA